MADSLTAEQRELAAEIGRNVGAARATLHLLSGLDGIDAGAALVTALTTLIDEQYAPEHRLAILSGLLGPTIRSWAARASGCGATLQ